MSEAYNQLLEATIQHLEELKERGVRFVPLTAEKVLALRRTRPVATGQRSAPTPVPATAPAAPVPVPTPPRQITPAAARLTPTPVPERTDKTAAFARLRESALACVKCPQLVAARANVVFGVGNIDAELMFVGEAPGADEDAQGEPFVGKAGQLLTKIIQAMGLSRDSVHREHFEMPAGHARRVGGNRKPTSDEMQTCIPYLEAQIDLIRPKLLVALGATAIEGLLGKTAGITRLRGNWQSYRGIPLMPTYHPAYLLRNQLLSEKRRVWEDMLQVMEKLELPISEKQRNFFLKTGS